MMLRAAALAAAVHFLPVFAQTPPRPAAKAAARPAPVRKPPLTVAPSAPSPTYQRAAGETPAIQQALPRPQAGPVEIMKSAEVKAGMQGVAWTVFEGSEPEAVPVEIIGPWKNAWGPGQDVILAKMGGRAQRTNVAGGMSGSPVYVDGRLIGAVALRLSVFSPDAICGITPIEHMLEINSFDRSRPAQARAPGEAPAQQAALEIPNGLLAQVLAAGGGARFPAQPLLVPIETPLAFSGFHEDTLRAFQPYLQQMGVTAVQGGAAGTLRGSTPAPGWQKALQPGEAIAGVLVSGDLSVTGLGTVTYNDGKRVLGFGHSFFNLGPVDMPMARSEVLMVLSSAFQPNKFANATEIAGALRQDRHSGIMGELGQVSPTIPVTVKVRSHNAAGAVMQEKSYSFNAFVHQKWTPFLMMMTVFNTLQGINDFADETTFRLSGQVEIEGRRKLALSTMVTNAETPVPPAMQLAGWWADKFNRLYGNSVEPPRLRRAEAVIDLLPDRRTAGVESAWLEASEVELGGRLRGRIFLRPYRGERIERSFEVALPASLPRGEHRLLLSDADSLNRPQMMAGAANRFLDVEQTLNVLSQERTNDRVYLSVIEARPTVYYDDKALTGLPASIQNVLQAGRATGRTAFAAPETAHERGSLEFSHIVTGSTSLRFTVR